jgi:transcriptional regulator with XRE-family HTH domain
MKADRVLSENIQHLLRKRGQSQKDLAFWCGHTETWLSSILRGDRHFRILDYDRIADFFGIAVYQLFQPGISPLTERRSGRERRGGQDRRISQAQRAMLELQKQIDPHRVRRRVNGADKPPRES